MRSLGLLLLLTACGGAAGDPDGASIDARAGLDGTTVDAPVDAEPADARVITQACTFQQAEHPGYTTIARDVALCGSKYATATIATACAEGWHVCRSTEWSARYPARPYKAAAADEDRIGPTIGPLTSWGDPQAARCGGGVWEDSQPESPTPYAGSVCHYADDVGDNADGADYLPYNDGKFLFADDGTTVLQGVNALGDPDCCSWDVTFAPTKTVTDFAVYCCLD